MRSPWVLALAALVAIGCGDETMIQPQADSGADTGAADTGGADTGRDVPADSRTDTGVDVPADTAQVEDTGAMDTGVGDTGGAMDTGAADTGGGMDTGVADVRTDAPADTAADTTPPADVPSACTPTVPVGTAITLPSGGMPMAAGTTVGGMNRVAMASCQSSAIGPEAYHVLDVTARTGVLLNTNGSLSTFDTVLHVRRGCDPTMMEVACDDDAGDSNFSFIRTALDPGRYLVVVDGYGTSSTSTSLSGAYMLQARSFTLAGNAECATPQALTIGTPRMDQSTSGGYRASTACRTSDTGSQVFYSVAVPPGMSVNVTATPTGTPMWQPVVRVLDSCAATTCVTDARTTTAGTPTSVVFANTGAATRTFVVSVGTSNVTDVGTFNIAATAMAIMPGDVCETPRSITPGTALMGQDTARSTVRSAACLTSEGGQIFYALNVPAGQRATITATRTGATGTVRLRALDSCAATTCVTNASSSTAATISVANVGTAARDFVITGASTSTSTSVTYDLTATLTPLPDNAACERPATLTTATAITGVNTAEGVVVNTACTTGEGPQRFYTVAVPPGQRVTIRATRTSTSGTARVRVLESCTATTCLYNGVSSSTEALGYFANTGATMRNVLFSVAATSSSTPVTVTLSASLSPVAANADCATPAELTTTPVTGQDTATGGNPSNACATTEGGFQRWYRVSVPSRQRATISALRTSTTGTVRLRLVESCTATSCLQTASGSTGATVTAYNTAASPATALISLSSTSAATPITATLLATFEPIAANAACATPATLAPGATVMGDLNQGGAPGTYCRTGDSGPQLYYTVRVPAGQIGLVTMTPTGAFTPVLRVLQNCAATTCLTSAAGSSGMPLEIGVDNAAGTGPTDFVVSASSTSTPGTFTLAVRFVPAPYTQSTIAPMCDTFGALGAALPSTATSGAWGDDVRSEITALPTGFAFRFFGDVITHYSVTSNGFAQLWTSATGTPSTSLSNTNIPSTSTPNNFVAAFWDDLDISTASGVTSGIHVATLGAAPNRRFVIEWRDWAHNSEQANIRNTFQIKLFETTGVIEYHYCTLGATGEPLAFGDSATVGLENATGTLGRQSSINTEDSISTMRALRYTPAPAAP